jgi:hypothetical protein
LEYIGKNSLFFLSDQFYWRYKGLIHVFFIFILFFYLFFINHIKTLKEFKIMLHDINSIEQKVNEIVEDQIENKEEFSNTIKKFSKEIQDKDLKLFFSTFLSKLYHAYKHPKANKKELLNFYAELLSQLQA